MNSPNGQTRPEPTAAGSRPFAASDRDGVDRTLIRELRHMSPEARLEWHSRMVRLVLEMRDGLRR